MDTAKNMRLREWLIAQIDGVKYAGLCWENPEKTLFRIPWKHAAKQDYRQNEDAALFKAWAVYKGKYREGKDKADPSTWKTRLRCALNKSADFQEVPERSQLDISEPYKVYRVLPDSSRPAGAGASESPAVPATPLSPLGLQCGSNGESCIKPDSDKQDSGPKFTGWVEAQGYHETSAPLSRPVCAGWYQINDLRLRVRVFYQGQMVQDVTSMSPEGCFILQGSVPVGSERIYGPCAAERVLFPPLDVCQLAPSIADAMARLLPHLEKGVLVWVAPDGVFIKRFCQGRVYWDGPLAEHKDRPNKLERERTCKLLDMPIFLQEVDRFVQMEGPRPCHKIDLCFGEEFPEADAPKNRKLITAQVVPLFAKDLLQRLTQPGSKVAQRPHTLKSEVGAERHHT
ncbi:interferon regulatory factor 10 isoform X2 [Denticeps clupeoides]|uniref:IRF tryptophan pentad repeat domain-containing protein n=1 Tax=Denticeps clupeoides TaxID=299321 RepID=A0AAY4CYG2_9TELE|nr:interferon regulatory factor 4-like isoform X2 [Denticeps clupeoides]